MPVSRFRAEVVGSLLRPSYLKEAWAARDGGRIPLSEYKAIEDRAVREAIALQEECGVDVVTDGEMRRFLFTGPLTEVVEGITETPGATFTWHGPEGKTFDYQIPISVTSKLRRVRSLATEEYAFARAVTDRPLKVTLPSPLMLTELWSPEHSPEAYDDPFDLFEDAARIISEEVHALAAMGCQNIQIDAPELTTLIDPHQRQHYNEIGVDTDRFLTDGLDLINAVMDGVDGVRFSMHLCRGNNEGFWLSSGGYEAISKDVFGRVRNVHTFLLEYDDERSGSFEALRDVPEDKTVALGLVSTKHAEVETAEDLIRRVEDASRYFPREQLALCTQCGFASGMEGNPLDTEAEKGKLKVLAEAAHRIWGG